MLKLEIIDSTDNFRDLRDEWNQLLNNSNADNIFLTWEWQFNWWKAFNDGNQLNIILCRNENDNLLGIAPLYIQIKKLLKLVSFNELRFIGYGSEATSEYLDFICYKNKEGELVEAILDSIYNSTKKQDIFVIADMADDSSAKRFILKYIIENKFNFIVKEGRPFCPIIKFNSNWDSYICSLSKLMRKNLRSYRKKIEQNFAVEVKQFDNISESNGAFSEFQRLYASRRFARNEKNKYISENYKSFQEGVVKAFSDKKWLHLCLLFLNKIIVSAQYSFQYKNKLYLYQMGSDEQYAKFNVSQNLMNYVLENATKQKIDECDLLRGEEWYKMRLANGLRKKIRIVISYESALGACYVLFLKFKNASSLFLKRAIPRPVIKFIEHKTYS